jgi:gamma-glutamyltranspeptidase/glutathione hydrolase
MTDFAFRPAVDDKPVSNRIEPEKRPRSSMAPTLVFGADGKLLMTLGSSGGARLIGYVVQTLIATLDWGLDLQKAIELPRHVDMNGPILLERNTPLAQLSPALQAMGHAVEQRRLASGIHGIMIDRKGEEPRLIGGADPRREGVAVGD